MHPKQYILNSIWKLKERCLLQGGQRLFWLNSIGLLRKKALQLAKCATAELWRFSMSALDIFLVLLQRAIGHENGALGRGEGRTDIEDNAGLLGVIGGDGVAKNIGNAA